MKVRIFTDTHLPHNQNSSIHFINFWLMLQLKQKSLLNAVAKLVKLLSVYKYYQLKDVNSEC